MKRFPLSARRRAVTLIEVMIAALIMGVVTIGAITTLLVSSRMALNAQEDMMALEMLNRQVELVKSDGEYANIGTNQPSGVVDFFGTDTIPYDPNFPDTAPVFTVEYEWFGFGTISSTTSNSMTFDSSDWPADTPDFTDHFLILREGNQIARISADTGPGSDTRTFTIDYNLNDWGNASWGTFPPNGARFEIDGGKWCRITMSWEQAGGGTRTSSREVFVPWRAQ